MGSLNLADMFVTFLALLGPQKVLLSFARLGQTLDVRSVRTVAMLSAIGAAIVGTICALAAPLIATFFHIGSASLQLAAGLVFFVYAVGLVLGVHFDGEGAEPSGGSGGSGGSGAEGGADAEHPLTSGFRAMLLPFVVSPLGVAATLEESLSAHGWSGRWTVDAAFAAVAFVDLACAWVFAPLLHRTHSIVLEILSRLLGVLLTAVGVQLFLQGLAALGVHGLTTH
ncbi:MAG TPA: MarC family protein [Trebonia sp.]|nr:MarC family protein [Trebonia sp.]